MFLTAFITVVAAYLIGSINFAVIFSKIFIHKDIRNFGSGNAGATNVLRTGGVALGVLTFICDALKGFIASGIGWLIFKYIYNITPETVVYLPIYGAYFCGLACMLGHVFPLFFGFKGGKGVASSVGIMAVCSPVSILVGLGVFVLILFLTKYVSLSSVVSAAVTVVMALILGTGNETVLIWPPLICLICMFAIVLVKHIDNIKRLIAGTENKIGRKHV